MSDDLYQKIIDNSPDFVFESRVDNFQFTKVNKRACKFYGYSKSEFLNMNIFDIEVSPPLKEQVKKLYDNTPIGSVIEVFGTNKKKDGTTFPVHVRFSKINKEFAIANVRDITEQRNNEKALHKAYIKLEKRTQELQNANDQLKIYETLIECIPQVIWVGSSDGQVTFINEAWKKWTGREIEESLGTKWAESVHPDDVGPLLKKWENAYSLGKPYQGECRFLHQNGRVLYCSFIGIPVKDADKKVNFWAGIDYDITELKKVQKSLQKANENLDVRVKERTIGLSKSREQLRALASRLESIREEERINISRKIHDELGHSLTGIQFDLQALSKLPELQKKEISDKLNSINKLVHQSLETLKGIASDLRPGVLDKLGLDAAIEWQLNQFQARTKIKCNQNLEDLPSNINSTKSTTVFRIFQEILTNIIRHSQADEVIVTLRIDQNNIVLNVKDNGIGIRKDDLESVDSLGLLGMRERATMTGGALKIARMKKGGTEVNISIPV